MKPRGLSMVELVLCITLLAMVFLVVMNLVPVVVLGGVEARHRLVAVTRAGEVLDNCSSGPYSRLQIGSYDADNPGRLAGYLNDLIEDGITYRSSVQIVAIAGIDPKNARRVKVRVTWQERKKTLEAARLRTVSAVRR